MRDEKKIAEVVKDTVSATFDKVKILRVTVLSDADDDDVLNIEVVFDGTPKDLDARQVTGIVRHVRPKLTAIGEAAFPLMSFISKDDAGQLELA
jgi:hypothetical protein